MTEVAERNLSFALEIKVLPDGLVRTESDGTLSLKIFIPVTYRATVSLLGLIFVFIFVFHIFLMLLKFLFQRHGFIL
jgi:hypothetical protein